MKKIVGIILLSSLIGACAAPFQVAPPDQSTGKFKTRGKISEDELVTYKVFSNINESQYVYLNAESQMDQLQFENFMVESLKSIGFDKIFTEEELASYVIEKGLADSVPSISDLLALRRLAKIDGQFIYIDATVNNSGGCCWFKFDLKVYDPITGEKYLVITRNELNDLNFDNEVLYPVVNKVKDWRDDSVSSATE